MDVGFIILDGVLRLAVCFGQTEQMNKKVVLTRVKKTTHCKSRAHFLLNAPTKNRYFPTEFNVEKTASHNKYLWETVNYSKK